MKEIILTAVVNGTSTNQEGLKLYYAIKTVFDDGYDVKLSLKDASPMSSSFLNSSFGELVDNYGVDKIRKSIKLTSFKPSHAEQIKNYINDIAQYSK